MTSFVIPALILATFLYGGWRLIGDLRMVNLMSIRGALFGFVCLCRYLVYASGLVVIIVVFVITFIPDSNRSLSLDHAFKIELNEDVYAISSPLVSREPSTLQSLRGSVELTRTPDALILVVGVIFSALLVVLHQLFSHGEKVLLSLYQRVPFTKDNAEHTRRIAVLILAAWFIYYAYMLCMTLYLQPRLETEGFTLSLIELPWISAVFTSGIVFVLSEVFKVGFELKEEQDYTV